MEFDLRGARESAGISNKEAAEAAGIVTSFYRTYESRGEIPCKYAYKIWKAHPSFQLPEDFFYYTSFSMECNMRYHGMTQAEIARAFGFSSQGVISNFMSENIPMYELKDRFIETFDPLIVPCARRGQGGFGYITDLVPRGNFMSRRQGKRGRSPNIKELDVGELGKEGT